MRYMRKVHTIFDISAVEDDRSSVKRHLEEFLCSGYSHQIATVNPEFLLEARKNPLFFAILKECELLVPDGVGMHLWFWLQGKCMQQRIPGADLIEDIFDVASKMRLTVFLAVKKGGLSSFHEVKNVISKRYPNLNVFGADIDISSDFDVYNVPLSLSQAAIVLCNFGAPEQEIFIFRIKGGTMRIGIGVGGSFDYLTGKIPRAPKFMRSCGIEWMWRLYIQPSRWRRIGRVVLWFPLVALFDCVVHNMKRTNKD